MDPPAPFHPTATRRIREKNVVRVGIAVLVVVPPTEDGSECRIYAGVRKGKHGPGLLALPGGHLELMESFEDGARREIQEEMGVSDSQLCNWQQVHLTNNRFREENRHSITIFFMATLVPGGGGDGEENGRGDVNVQQAADSTVLPVPRNMEPDKCEGWKAKTYAELQRMAKESPDTLFLPLRRLLEDNPSQVQAYLDNARQQPSLSDKMEAMTIE